MADPFLGEIRMFAGNFAPRGWALCNGQLLPISQNQALFSILGTYYGGDGVSNFALPDLRSRVPLHQGQGTGLSPYQIGEQTGTESVTLLTPQMPAHTHLASASSAIAGQPGPANNLWAAAADSTGTSVTAYNAPPGNATMAPAAISPAGGSQPHPNIQPVLAVTFIIALNGMFPSRN